MRPKKDRANDNVIVTGRSGPKSHVTVFMKTFGCQMNQADTEVAMGILQQSELGIEFVDDMFKANVVILNTCSVRGHAEERVFGTLRKLTHYTEKHHVRRPIVGIIGCMAVEYRERFFEKFPIVSFVMGNKDLDKLPDFLYYAHRRDRQIAVTEEGYGVHGEHDAVRAEKIRALVPITHGCDNFCSYCIVPYVRGREISRPMADIIDEVRELTKHGYKQIMFLGQNVNSFGKGLSDKATFTQLLRETAHLDGVEIVEFMTAHPKDMAPELIDIIADEPKVSKHVHLPLQSGSDRILKAMNRQYTTDQYLKIIRRLQERVVDITLTTDIIIGFPGETEDDFAETVRVMESVPFDHAFIFKYSPREGTKAADMPDDVPFQVKEQRNQVLLELQRRLTADRNQRLVGKVLKAVVFSESSKNTREMIAVTMNDKLVVVPRQAHQIGDVIRVRLDSFTSQTFKGTVV